MLGLAAIEHPALHDAIVAFAEHRFAVGRKRHRARLHRKRRHHARIVRAPDLDLAVGRRAREERAVRGKRDPRRAIHPLRAAEQLRELARRPRRLHGPHHPAFVFRAGHHPPPVGRKREASDGREMSAQRSFFLPRRGVPNSQRTIVAARRERFSIRRKREAPDRIEKRLERVLLHPAIDRPHFQHAVEARRDHARAVRRKREPDHGPPVDERREPPARREIDHEDAGIRPARHGRAPAVRRYHRDRIERHLRNRARRIGAIECA